MPLHAYSLFGLHLHSTIELPELHAVAPLAVSDVVISRGAVDIASGLSQLPQPVDDGFAIRVDDIATYAIRSGSSIMVDAAAGAAPRNVRLYLLGSAMGMLLHQRGILPLHANAVEIDGRAFVFMGASGAGKSTLAAWFNDRGHRVIADDVCALTFDQRGRPVTCPGLPRLRLWSEALTATGRLAKNFSRSYFGTDEWEKYDVPLSKQCIPSPTLLVGGIYWLERGAVTEVRRLTGIDALDALFSNTYRGSYLALAGHPTLHLQACAQLARDVPMFTASRRWGYDYFELEGALLAKHARALAVENRRGNG